MGGAGGLRAGMLVLRCAIGCRASGRPSGSSWSSAGCCCCGVRFHAGLTRADVAQERILLDIVEGLHRYRSGADMQDLA